jgi:hypothetical protein
VLSRARASTSWPATDDPIEARTSATARVSVPLPATPSETAPVENVPSVAVRVHAAGSAVPSRQNFTLIAVPSARRRIHQAEPAAPELVSVPLPSVTTPPLPFVFFTSASAHVAAPALVCPTRAT